VSNKIGRVTTAGSFTEYAIPTRGSGAAGIAAGPDGNLWFTEAMSNKIGRITAGLTTPTIAWSNPSGIVYGTALSATQLNATATNPNNGASVAGTFTYTPAAGAVLGAGNQTLSEHFVPNDTADYNTPLDQTVTINVAQASPAFSGLTASQAISYGTSTITVSGTLSAPTATPAGQQVSVSVGGASATATVQADATFTATIDTHAIGAATTPYAITYSYTGDTNFKSASDSSTTLTVNTCTTLTNAVVAQSGGSPAGQGSVTINDCDATLREGDSFDVTLSLPIAIPTQASTLNFNYSNLAFDTTSQGRIKDAFEVALVDASGNSLVPTIAANRDAFLNVAEGQPAALGAWATSAGQTITLDVSHVTPGTAATLVFRLVNNDGDVNTSVVVGSVRVAPLTGQPVDPGGQPAAPTVSSPAAIDFAHLADVSASIQPVYGRTSFDQPNGVLYADLAAQNAGQYFVDAPLIVAIDHLSDPSVRVRGANGMTPDGLPYFDLTALVPCGKLAAGGSTATRTIAFSDPGGIPFTYNLVFLGHLNRPPQFTSAPKLRPSSAMLTPTTQRPRTRRMIP